MKAYGGLRRFDVVMCVAAYTLQFFRTYTGYLQRSGWVSLFLLIPMRVRLHKNMIILQQHLWL